VVTSTLPDATDDLLQRSGETDLPETGEQYFLISLRATYNGSEEASALYRDLIFSAVGASELEYALFTDFCLFQVPNEIVPFEDISPGGVVEGDICFSVKVSDAADLLLMVQENGGPAEARSWMDLRP